MSRASLDRRGGAVEHQRRAGAVRHADVFPRRVRGARSGVRGSRCVVQTLRAVRRARPGWPRRRGAHRPARVVTGERQRTHRKNDARTRTNREGVAGGLRVMSSRCRWRLQRDVGLFFFWPCVCYIEEMQIIFYDI